MSLDNSHASDHSSRKSGHTVGRIVAHILGWGLYVLGFVPWAVVVPIVAVGKLLGNQAGRFEHEAIMLSLFAYGIVSLIGLLIIAVVLGNAHRITKIALSVYLAFLAIGIIVRFVG